jgi:hypothetical protein
VEKEPDKGIGIQAKVEAGTEVETERLKGTKEKETEKNQKKQELG